VSACDCLRNSARALASSAADRPEKMAGRHSSSSATSASLVVVLANRPVQSFGASLVGAGAGSVASEAGPAPLASVAVTPGSVEVAAWGPSCDFRVVSETVVSFDPALGRAGSRGIAGIAGRDGSLVALVEGAVADDIEVPSLEG
jgi:hypothetical protein